MSSKLITALSLNHPARAKRLLAVILVILALVSASTVAYLSSRGFRHLKRENLLRYKAWADDLSTQIDANVQFRLSAFRVLASERWSSDPEFSASGSALPGTLFYFSIGADGKLETHSAESDENEQVLPSGPTVEQFVLGRAVNLLEIEKWKLQQRLGGIFAADNPLHLDSLELEPRLLALFRVTSGERRSRIQGAVVDLNRFFQEMLGDAFSRSQLARRSVLELSRGGVSQFRYRALNGPGADEGQSGQSAKLVPLRSPKRLPRPFDMYELTVLSSHIPYTSASFFISVAAILLGVVMPLGLLGVYWIGARHIDFAKQQSDFAAAVSHELRTPLAAILMRAEALREGWVPEESRAETYDAILEDGRRLNRLIGSILQLTGVQHHAIPLEVLPADVNLLVRENLARLDGKIRAAGFEVRCSGSGNSETVPLDRDLFGVVLTNLIDNSLKFSREAEHKTIEVSVLSEGAEVAMSVRDYGPGVSGESLSSLGEIFRRGNDELTRRTTGTGIGLALVKQSAGLMNACIQFSNAQPGLKVTVSFPRTFPPADVNSL